MLKSRPRVIATVRRDGSGEVAFNGNRIPIEGRSVQDAGAIAIDLVAQRAAGFRRPLRMTAQSPHDTRVLMVYADGRVIEAKDSSLRPAHLVGGVGALAVLGVAFWLWGLPLLTHGGGGEAPAVAVTPAVSVAPEVTGVPVAPAGQPAAPEGQPAAPEEAPQTPADPPAPAQEGMTAPETSLDPAPSDPSTTNPTSAPKARKAKKAKKQSNAQEPSWVPPANPAPRQNGGSGGKSVVIWD
ncbi:MAG: hypothetical protein FWD59_08570 [Micrococcales bacterium]|nr:hypothetical protein [Micrococcales bacterium]